MANYLVERYWPGVTPDDVVGLDSRLSGVKVRGARFVGSLLIPVDEVVLVELVATNLDAALDLARRAGLRVDRIVGITHPGAT